MEEEEGGSYEAMMDDQNHNNWEAAVDGFRQPPPPPPPPSSIPAPAREPPGGQLLAMPAVSVDRKGPKEGLPMGPPPEPNGVIMMLKSCDAAAAVAKAAPAATPTSSININTSTSKFCEYSLSSAALAFLLPTRTPNPSFSAIPLPLFQAWVSPLLPASLLRLVWCPRPAPERPWLLVLPGLKEQPGYAHSPKFSYKREPYHDWLSLSIRKLFSSPFPLKFHPQT